MPLTRRAFLGATPLALGQASQPSNILLILMDDLGYPTLSSYGNKLVATPHLDGLAREGVRFTNAYVTPQCTPTRATILTGQYTARNKMWHVIPWYGYPYARMAEEQFKENLAREDFNLAKGLQAAGYRTGIFGKWHLTANADGNYTNLRAEASRHYGFDTVSQPPAIANEQNTGDKAVDRLTNEAIEFLNAERGKPWFCYLSHHSIHNRVSAPDALVRKYRERGAPEKGLGNATYLGALEHMDNSVGRLLGALKASGQAENTAVVFLSDNGGVARNHFPGPKPDPDGMLRPRINSEEFPSTPLRAWKGSAYEGGIRVPMIARFPGQKRRGVTDSTPVHAVDLLPTFFSLARATPPSGHALDGADLGPRIRTGRPLAQRDLFWYMPFYDMIWLATPSAAVRSGDWKLIEYFGDWVEESTRTYRTGHRVELYNLKRDLGETRDLSAAEPARVKDLLARLHRWMDECGAKVPVENPRFDPPRALDTENRRRA